MTSNMLNDWKTWCRLCAKFNGTDFDVFLKMESFSEISSTVQKFFMIALSPFDGTSRTICDDCFKLITKLDRFAERCVRVDKMFAELVYDNWNTLDGEVHVIRSKYGLNEEDQQYLESDIPKTEKIMIDQATDVDELTKYFPDIVTYTDPGYTIHRKRKARARKTEVGLSDVMIKEEKQEDETSYTEYYAYNDEDYDEDEEKKSNHVAEIEKDEYDESGGRHSRQKINDKTLTCDICGKFFKRIKFLNHHMKSKHGEKSKKSRCNICLKAFSNKKLANLHEASHAMDEGEGNAVKSEGPFVCTKCPKSFNSEKKVKLHEICHLPESEKLIHPCPYCDKKFSKSVNVTAHVRSIHIGERPFVCEECGKSFATKGALKEHQITHSDERPFQCAHCPKKFKNLPRLRTHEDIHNDTIYVCPHCGMQLNTKRTLKMHMVVHSDQKKYKCHFCGNEYKRSKALKNHLILHTGLRPYTCPFCDKTFANGSNCRSHKKKSHPLELAALEASGQILRATNIPKLEHLQPKTHFSQKDLVESQMPIPIMTDEYPKIKTEESNQNLSPVMTILNATTPNVDASPNSIRHPLLNTMSPVDQDRNRLLLSMPLPIPQLHIPSVSLPSVSGVTLPNMLQ